MLLFIATLITAVSALTIPKDKDITRNILQKDIFDNCTIIRDHSGDSVYDCPGCLLIIGRDGKLRLRTGDKCSKYCDDDRDHRADVFGNENCWSVNRPNGDTFSQCSECQEIFDKNGEIKFEKGPKCQHESDVKQLFEDALEAELLKMQG